MAGSWPLAGCGLNLKCTRGERNIRHASVRFGCFLSVTPFPHALSVCCIVNFGAKGSLHVKYIGCTYTHRGWECLAVENPAWDVPARRWLGACWKMSRFFFLVAWWEFLGGPIMRLLDVRACAQFGRDICCGLDSLAAWQRYCHPVAFLDW